VTDPASPAHERPSRRRRGTRSKRVIRWAVALATVALLAVLARRVDWATTLRALRSADPLLLALALAANTVSLLTKGVSWWLFLRAAGARSLGLALRATAAGSGLNNVLVANGGDVARVAFVSRATHVPSSTVLATLAIDRLLDTVGYVLLLVFSTLLLPLPEGIARWRGAALAVLAALGVLLGWLVRRSGGIEPAEVHAAALMVDAGVPVPLWARVGSYFRRFARSVAALATARRMAVATLLYLVAWLGQALTFGLVAESAGVHLPVAGHVATLLAVNVSFLLRPTPGNVGFFQLVYALTAAAFGVPRHTAVAVALLIQALQIIPTTAVGIALAPELVFRRRRAPRNPRCHY
jgi:uncharacterized protein (TIRG00374 family)